jgi:hypothetical protein
VMLNCGHMSTCMDWYVTYHYPPSLHAFYTCFILFQDSNDPRFCRISFLSSGKKIMEGPRVCPICREYVLKLLHVFRA